MRFGDTRRIDFSPQHCWRVVGWFGRLRSSLYVGVHVLWTIRFFLGLFVSHAFAGIGSPDDQNSESSQCRRTSRGLPPRGVRHRLAVDCVQLPGLEFRSFERNVPCSSEGAWVYEWRVEDVGLVDYVVLVLLDFDECFLGLG
ncbi:hypothetical protein F2Q69_00030246 [Brassica cretica]|uniref:Uncharacterized protein n=1 Tax=Brassica cretica TaxID=69181 RepID=A0A8S9RU76_BRACR|nr:hypothetical protein F2Q69_00030246 [Brassica cretica]